MAAIVPVRSFPLMISSSTARPTIRRSFRAITLSALSAGHQSARRVRYRSPNLGPRPKSDATARDRPCVHRYPDAPAPDDQVERGIRAPYRPRSRPRRPRPGGEDVAPVRVRLLAHPGHRASRHPLDHGDRRTARPAEAAGGRGPCGGGRQCAGDLLPHGRGPRVVVRRGPGPPGGGGHRRRGPRPGCCRRARARHQHQADPPVRPQLRVPVRGPAGVRAPRSRAGRRRPEPGCRDVAQALRREQPGDGPAPGQRRGGRADPARDLPGRLRARGPHGAAVDSHV